MLAAAFRASAIRSTAPCRCSASSSSDAAEPHSRQGAAQGPPLRPRREQPVQPGVEAPWSLGTYYTKKLERKTGGALCLCKFGRTTGAAFAVPSRPPPCLANALRAFPTPALRGWRRLAGKHSEQPGHRCRGAGLDAGRAAATGGRGARSGAAPRCRGALGAGGRRPCREEGGQCVVWPSPVCTAAPPPQPPTSRRAVVPADCPHPAAPRRRWASCRRCCRAWNARWRA